MNERQTAFLILSRIEKDKAYANLLLDNAIRVCKDATASAFLTALVYGVIERKITLDYILSKYLSKPIKRLSPEVLTILRMGVYQLKFMDKIPPSAAVNESVKLSKKNHAAYASGLINSVLRKVHTSAIELPVSADNAENLSIQYSCPQCLVERFIKDYGIQNTVGILKSSLELPPTTVRVNTTQISIDDFKQEMEANGITTIDTPLINSFHLSKSSGIEQLNAYQKGYFHLQDLASSYCVEALDLQPNDVFFDLCAAPGGKSFTAAEIMKNQGEIRSFDLYETRVNRMQEGASRLSLSIIQANVADAQILNQDLVHKADKVLCDVPCSGFGTIRRKPEIKYKDLASIDKLPELQYNILNNAVHYLKDNGILMYSTCTLNKFENDAVCDRFLREHPDYEFIGEYNTLFPHIHKSDGFFYAKFRRKHDS